MSIVITVFLVALALSLLLTPLASRTALRFNLVDTPTDRRIHTIPIPRIGGIALFCAFWGGLGSLVFFESSRLPTATFSLTAVIIGAIFIFGVGLTDDLHPLPPWVKFCAQLLAGLICFLGDVRISNISISQSLGLELDWLALPATLFWFVLVINAINLIDGLDGLAAGVTLFVSLLLLTICINADRLAIALGFAALGGATLGFLRYNFNPASIFMGDSGSYFLGYTLAALSVLGSIKGQTTVAMLIPFIALGVPLFDALWAPIRRFILGQKLFSPDREHLHHRLLKLGLTQRRAVFTLYAITLLLGITSFLLVHARDEQAGLILLIPGTIIILGVRKLGYLEYLAVDKVYGWLRDITDATGISPDRRSFLNLQMRISESRTMEELWAHSQVAIRHLQFDHALLRINTPDNTNDLPNPSPFSMGQPASAKDAAQDDDCCLRLELPLLDNRQKYYGTLHLEKNLRQAPISHYTLRRVEHLRRSMTETIEKIVDF